MRQTDREGTHSKLLGNLHPLHESRYRRSLWERYPAPQCILRLHGNLVHIPYTDRSQKTWARAGQQEDSILFLPRIRFTKTVFNLPDLSLCCID